MADSEEQVSSTQADDDAEPQASTADAPDDAQPPGTSAASTSDGDPSSSAQPEPSISQAAEEKPSRAELVARARNLQQTLNDRREHQETQAVVKQVQHALDTHPDRDLTATEIGIFAIFCAPADLKPSEWERLYVKNRMQDNNYLARHGIKFTALPPSSERPFNKQHVSTWRYYPAPFFYKGHTYCWFCCHKTTRGDLHGMCPHCFAKFDPVFFCGKRSPCDVCKHISATAINKREDSIYTALKDPIKAFNNANK